MVKDLSHKCRDLRCDPKNLHEARHGGAYLSSQNVCREMGGHEVRQYTSIIPGLLQRRRRKQEDILKAHGPESLVIAVEDKRPCLEVERKD